MVQEQLVEYISSQMKLGVARDAVKAALVGAGWAATDVDDTLRKVDGMNKPSAPAAAGPAVASPVARSSEPQSIRVSDLISSSVSAAPSSKNTPASSPAVAPKIVQKPASKPLDLSAAASPSSSAPKKKGGLVMMIVGVVLILGFGGLAGFLYWQNSGLTTKIASLGTMSADVASQVAGLTAQVQALDASNTALAANVDSLSAENLILKANLSFSAIPPASAGAPSSETVSISGVLTAGKTSYVLTTPYGVTVFVQNSKDAKVDAALKPLAGTAGTVTLTGTHVPGSQFITVSVVNGSALQ
jgi:cell division protein FtsB